MRMTNFFKHGGAAFSSQKIEYGTPQPFFDGVVKCYGSFDRDVCASHENYKVKPYWTIEEDALKQEWNGFLWMNPPYAKNEIINWVQKAFESTYNNGANIIALLPMRSDTKWFQNYVLKPQYISQIVIIKGRLSFEGGKTTSAFPSVVVHYDYNHKRKNIQFFTADRKFRILKVL